MAMDEAWREKVRERAYAIQLPTAAVQVVAQDLGCAVRTAQLDVEVVRVGPSVEDLDHLDHLRAPRQG
jgi:hypothetical protein